MEWTLTRSQCLQKSVQKFPSITETRGSQSPQLVRILCLMNQVNTHPLYGVFILASQLCPYVTDKTSLKFKSDVFLELPIYSASND